MANPPKKEELRKMIRKVVSTMPEDKKKDMQELVIEALRTHFSTYVQEMTMECAEDIGIHPFDVMVDLMPLVTGDLLKALIINILGNTPEDKVKEMGEMIDALQQYLNDSCFDIDHMKMWKSIQAEMLEATVKGHTEFRTVKM